MCEGTKYNYIPYNVTDGETLFSHDLVWEDKKLGYSLVLFHVVPCLQGEAESCTLGWGEPGRRVTNIPGVCDPVFLILWAHVCTDEDRVEYESATMCFCRRMLAGIDLSH